MRNATRIARRCTCSIERAIMYITAICNSVQASMIDRDIVKSDFLDMCTIEDTLPRNGHLFCFLSKTVFMQYHHMTTTYCTVVGLLYSTIG